MRAGQRLRIIIISCLIVSLLAGSSQNFVSDEYHQILDAEKDTTLESPFLCAAAPIYDYVDSFVADPTRGSHSTPPPDGMGDNETGSTTLTETQYSSSSWSTIQSVVSFGSLPSGWTDDAIWYEGGYFIEETGQLTGLISSSSISG